MPLLASKPADKNRFTFYKRKSKLTQYMKHSISLSVVLIIETPLARFYFYRALVVDDVIDILHFSTDFVILNICSFLHNRIESMEVGTEIRFRDFFMGYVHPFHRIECDIRLY